MNHKNEKQWDLFILPWIGILLLISIPLSIPSGAAETTTRPQVQEGLSVLQQLSVQDPAAVDRILRQREEESLRQQAEADRKNAIRERMEALEQGSVWEHFSNYAILGDSRASAFAEYHYLDSSRVLAGIGETIWVIPDKLSDVSALSPAYVFIAYGVNEVVGSDWPTGEDYAAAMEQRIGQVREAAPGAKIILSSILPVTDSAVARTPKLGSIPEYNAALQAMCKRADTVYVDNDDIADRYMDSLWEPDGIHQRYDFYPYWAKNLLLGVVAADFDLDSTAELYEQTGNS